MPNLNRLIALLCLLIVPVAGSASSLAEILIPGTQYYFESFNPGQKPWVPGQQLNIEEVFKNYEYFEIVLDQNGQVMTVNQYIQGVKKKSEKYRVLPDGALQKE